MKSIVKNAAGIYVHIPFCCKLCPYCDFYSLIGIDKRGDDFIRAIIGEIEARAGQYKSWELDTIFFGGGTPSLYSPLSLGAILEVIRSNLNLAADIEISLESNPSSLSEEKLSEYRNIGINRLSIGIQSFSDENLKTLGRIHDSKTAIESYNSARKAGFDNINIDLIYGLPGQTPDQWSNDLSRVISLNPDHISAYNLIIEPNTPFGEMYREGKLDLPSDDDQRNMYYLLNDRLIEIGYKRYELSNFARTGKQCRHNLKYWENGRYIGVGPSAVTCDRERRSKNSADLDKYIEHISQGKDAFESTEQVDAEKAKEERVMMGLRLSTGLSLSGYRGEFGIDLAEEKKNELSLLIERGLIEIDGDRVKIARDGLFISDEITVRLI